MPLTPRDDVKKAVSEILKRIDQFLKAGELEHAISQIERAKELDPKNVYVFAVEERIAAMKEERRQADEIASKRRVEEDERKKKEEAVKKKEEEKRRAEADRRREEEEKRRLEEERQKAIEAEKRREEEERRRKEEEEKQRKEEERRSALEARRRAEEEQKKEIEVRKKIDEERARWKEKETKESAPPPKPAEPEQNEEKKEVKEEEKAERAEAPPSKIAEIPSEVLEETKRKILADRKKKGVVPKMEVRSTKAYRHGYDEGVDIYRRALMEAWADGATTAAEQDQLENLRSSLMITPEDHDRLEKEAKLSAYRQGFRRAWSAGAISPESASALAQLRKRFKISMEEHEQIEAQLLWELRSSSQKAQVLIIDDDEKLLKVVCDTLQEAGYQPVAVTTTDEAFDFLKDGAPDIIISDINLETSTMGGFTFYEKVREIERLHEIPFIFLSGLTDEVLIRTGKELGVDDYLTKPFSDDTLLATIRGKLKRYRQLRKSRLKN